MVEYKILLDYKINDCMGCPFRHEVMQHESVQSADRLSGVIDITRRASHCVIKKEPVIMNERVDGYNSQCPLKGKDTYIPDEKMA